MNQKVSSHPSRFGVLVGAAVALSSAIGCLPNSPALHPRRSGVPTVVDRATCVDRHVQSIWKGEDIAGPECTGFIAQDRFAADAELRRFRKVCERTQIRTILTGEAPTPFTSRTCAARALLDEQPAISRTCRAVARAQGQSLNLVQRVACGEHLHDELAIQAAPSEVAGVPGTP
jgi:hypothetical protein